MKLEFIESGSPDCPLIRIYGFDKPAALKLMASLRALADGSQQRIPLHDQLGVETVQGCTLDLGLGNQNRGIEQTSATTFECILTSEGWAAVADLAQPLCESEEGNKHFQWLNEDGKVSLLLSPTGRW